MLKGIPTILSPELLKRLCEMGHGDTLVLADGNFPAEALGKNGIVVRADGHGTLELLRAILDLFPLDTYVPQPVALMEVSEGDKTEVPIWSCYEEIIAKADSGKENRIKKLRRQDFYNEASKAYLIIATGEMAIYANIILRKGIIVGD